MDAIFDEGFENWKYYAFRLNYSLTDYQNGHIHYTYRTIKPTIWLTLNAWIVMISLLMEINYKNNPYMLDIDHYDLIKYRSSFNDFLVANTPFDYRQLPPKSLDYLIRLYSRTNYYIKLSHQM
ncbi:hypothetical protein BLA29_012077, partial [Euroglyphus maynei]